MRLLAMRLGCSLGTLTYHFKSKEALLQHVFTEGLEARTAIFRDWDLGDDFIDDMLALYRRVLPLGPESDREWRVILAYWSRVLPSSPADPSAVSPVFTHGVDVSVELWRKGLERGLVRADVDPELISAQLLGLVTGLAFHMLHRPLSERERMLDPLRVFLEGHII